MGFGHIRNATAAEIEGVVLAVLKAHQQAEDASDSIKALERVVVARNRIHITMARDDLPRPEIVIPWTTPKKDSRPTIEGDSFPKEARNESLIQSIVHAHAWMHLLEDGT